MNENLQRLLPNPFATDYVGKIADEETVQEFAKLIIQECIKSIHATTDESIDLGRTLGENASWIENDIKKQFGVE